MALLDETLTPTPTDDYTFAVPDTQTTARNRERRRKAAMEMLAASANQPRGEMIDVGKGMKYYVDRQDENQVPFLRSAVGSYMQSGIDKEEQDEAKQLQDIRSELLRRMPAASDPAALQQWGAQASQHPQLAALGGAAFKQAIEPPKTKERTAPAGYAWNDNGSLSPIQGGPADKKRNPPSGFNWNEDGTLSFVPGGPGDPRYKQSIHITTGNRGALPKPPSGYKWNGEELEPIKGGPADPSNAKASALTPKQKETQRGFTDLEKSLNHYESLLGAYDPQGGSAVSPTNRAALESAYTDLQMKIKTLYELGAPQAGDLALLQQSLSNPTSIGGTLRGAAFGKEPFLAKTGEIRNLLNNSRESFDEQMGTASPRQAPTSPRQAGGVIGGKPKAPQAAIDMLKANPALAPAFQQKYGYLP